MKKVLIFLIALAVSIPAFAELKVDFSGGAAYRYGYQQMTGDDTDQIAAVIVDTATGTTTNTDYITYSGVNAGLAALGTDVATLYAAAGADYTNVANWIETNFGAAEKAGFLASVSESNWDAAVRGRSFTGKYNDEAKIMGLKTENAPFLIADIEYGKLTARIGYEVSSDGVAIKDDNAWAQYTFDNGLALKYYANSFGAKWVDGKFFGNGQADVYYAAFRTQLASGAPTTSNFTPCALEVSMMGAYVGVLSNSAYTDLEARKIPILHFGYGMDTDTFAFNVGAVLDMPTEDGGDYTGYLVYAKGIYKLGDKGGVQVGVNYGVNHAMIAPVTGTANYEAFFAGQSGAVGDDNTSAYLVQVSGGYFVAEGLLVSGKAQFGQQWFKEYDNAYTAQKYEAMVKQYLSENVGIGIGGGYEKYSSSAGDEGTDPASGFEVVIEGEYRF